MRDKYKNNTANALNVEVAQIFAIIDLNPLDQIPLYRACLIKFARPDLVLSAQLIKFCPIKFYRIDLPTIFACFAQAALIKFRSDRALLDRALLACGAKFYKI